MIREGRAVITNDTTRKCSTRRLGGFRLRRLIIVTMITVGLLAQGSPANAQTGGDPAIIFKTFEVAGTFGPQRGYGASENGNLTIPIDTILAGPAYLSTQAPPSGFADEGFGLGVKWIPSLENSSEGLRHRSANHVETFFLPSGISKDFTRGDLRQLRPIAGANTPKGSFELIYPDGSSEVYSQVTSKGVFLSSSIDPFGNATTFSYVASSPIPTAITLPAGQGVLAIENDGRFVTKMTSPNMVSVSFTYTNNRIAQITGPDGSAVLSLQYDKLGLGLPTSSRDAAGNQTLLAYKVKPGTQGPAAIAGLSTPDGEQYTFEHSKTSATMTDSKGVTTKVTLATSPGSGDIYAEKVFQGGRLASTVTLNNDGNIIESVDARGLSTKYSYAANGAIGSNDTSSPVVTGVLLSDGSKITMSLDSRNAFRPNKIVETSSGGVTKEQNYSWNGPKLLSTEVRSQGQQVNQITFTYNGNSMFPSSSEMTSTEQVITNSSGLPVRALASNGDVMTFERSSTSNLSNVNGVPHLTTLSVAADSSVTTTSQSPTGQVTRTSKVSGASDKVTLLSPSSKGMTLALARSSDKTLNENGGSSSTMSCDSVVDNCRTTVTCKPNGKGGCDFVTETKCSDKTCTPNCDGKLCGADDGCGNPCDCDFKNLNVSKNGSGSGVVTSDPTGIDCGGSCSHSYATGTKVSLTAKPDNESVFVGWSGACSGTGSCSVTISADTNVTATFNKAPKTYLLTVSKNGTGSGTVGSSPPGINCGATCSQSYNSGTQVTLTASPASGSVFAGWSGACSGTGSCTVTITAATSVIATFNTATPSYPLTVTKNGTGSGTVTSNPTGINCGSDCSESYTSGTRVTLTASPSNGSVFAGWSSPCSGTGTCTVTVSAATSVTATFNTPVVTYPLTVNKAGTGSGTVTSSPPGINCGSTCSQAYVSGTEVTLTASPDSGSVFAGWSGACGGTVPSCTVTMSAERKVTAQFNRGSQCVPDGSNASGSCCNGRPRCSDNYCRASCQTSCIPDGSNAPGTCCSGNRCTDSYCRTICPPLVCQGKTCNTNADCCSAYPLCKGGRCSLNGVGVGLGF